MFTIEHYLTDTGIDLYQRWLNNLRDLSARVRVTVRVNRFAAGALGDCKPLGKGVWELRINYGPGYRVYYAQTGKERMLLLMGGDKPHQDEDIQKAITCWHEYQRRSHA